MSDSSPPSSGNASSVAGRAVLEQFGAPDSIREEFTDLVIAAGGLVWSRPGLSRAQRSLSTISVLTALCRPDELRAHIRMGLDNGLTEREICETIMQCAIYAGFPAAVRAMEVAKGVFDA